MPGYDPVHERPHDWVHLIATSQVIARPCFLHTITINRPDVGAGALVSVYNVAAVGDIAPANLVANITMDDAFYVIPQTLIYDVELNAGLYILFSAGMTTGDITISYK